MTKRRHRYQRIARRLRRNRPSILQAALPRHRHFAHAALTRRGSNAAPRALAIDYAEKHIRFNALVPGAGQTPMQDRDALKFLGQYHPPGRVGQRSE